MYKATLHPRPNDEKVAAIYIHGNLPMLSLTNRCHWHYFYQQSKHFKYFLIRYFYVFWKKVLYSFTQSRRTEVNFLRLSMQT